MELHREAYLSRIKVLKIKCPPFNWNVIKFHSNKSLSHHKILMFYNLYIINHMLNLIAKEKPKMEMKFCNITYKSRTFILSELDFYKVRSNVEFHFNSHGDGKICWTCI